MKRIPALLTAAALLLSLAGCTVEDPTSDVSYVSVEALQSNIPQEYIQTTTYGTGTPISHENESETGTTQPRTTEATTAPYQTGVTTSKKPSESLATTVITPDVGATATTAAHTGAGTTAPTHQTATTTTTTTEASALQIPPDGATIINLGSSTTVDGTGVVVDGGKVTITEKGIYCVSGTLTDGMLEINSTGKVYLYLNCCNVTNSNGPALCVTDCKRIVVTVMDNTVNSFTDGGYDTVSNGAIFSHDTLEFNGNGTLFVNGNNREGIASNDDIIINSGTYHITSYDDGLNANDDITVNGGYVYVSAGGDGIDSKGTVNITGGTVVVGAVGELESGVEADGIFTINGGTVFAVGGSGILRQVSGTSTQSVILLPIGSFLAAGTLIRIECGGNPILTFTPAGAYSNLTISSGLVVPGKTYEMYVGGSCTGTCVDGVYSGGTYSGGTLLGSFPLA